MSLFGLYLASIRPPFGLVLVLVSPKSHEEPIPRSDRLEVAVRSGTSDRCYREVREVPGNTRRQPIAARDSHRGWTGAMLDVNFQEGRLGEARRTPTLRSWVNKSQRESRGFSPRPRRASAERRT